MLHILMTGPCFAVEKVCTLYASLKMEGVNHAFAFCSGLLLFEVIQKKMILCLSLEQMRRFNVHAYARTQAMLQKQPKMHSDNCAVNMQDVLFSQCLNLGCGQFMCHLC